jgi:hypothetical protein
MFVPATFRQTFPEFNDPAVFTDDVLNFWAGLAASFINICRWGTAADYGIGLFISHHLVISIRDQDAAESGGEPGKVVGVLTSKAVDKVSASYDAGSVTNQDAGFWNMTTYGIRFYNMSRLMGAGGMQVT